LTSAVLIENGPWSLLKEVAVVPSNDRELLERTIIRVNKHLRQSLGLRQDPIELRVTEGELQVRARGIAGTLSSGQLTLNIAPKFVPKADLEQEWSHSLLMLIRHASPRHVAFGRSMHLGTARLNFVDLLAMAFIDAVQAGVRDQIIQTYQVQELSLPTIRGRLNIQRQIRSTVQRPHLMECDVDQLDPLNPYNNLLKWAAGEFARTVGSSGLRRRMTDLARMMPGVPSAALAKRNPVVTPPPQYRSWQPALEIASLLCTGLTHTGKGGHHGYSFVFNLERLFEHFVEMTLHRAVAHISGASLTNLRQATTLYAVPELSNQSSFYSKPDNLLTDGERKVAVVDAKYKRLSDSSGDKDQKPQNQDVYELVAAMTAHQCETGILVYPKVFGDVLLKDDQLQVWYVEAFGKRLTIGAVAIDLMQLRHAEGTRIIDQHLASALENLLSRHQVS